MCISRSSFHGVLCLSRPFFFAWASLEGKVTVMMLMRLRKHSQLKSV